MRSAHDLVVAVAAIDPAGSFCLLPANGVTHCNSAARFMCAALGVPLLNGLANDQRDWLAQSTEWMPVDALTASQRAESGFPTIAVWKNPTGAGAHGHIALVVPAPLINPGHLHVAAAGATNTNCAPIERQFGLSLPVEFFTHD